VLQGIPITNREWGCKVKAVVLFAPVYLPSSTSGNLPKFYFGYSSNFICSFQRTSRSVLDVQSRNATGIYAD
jgi:hypothetical protein